MENNYSPPPPPTIVQGLISLVAILVMGASICYIGIVLQKKTLGIYDLEQRVEALENNSMPRTPNWFIEASEKDVEDGRRY